MNTGNKARLIQPVIQGEIVDTEYDKEKGCLRHLLKYTDADGVDQMRWFLETELEKTE